MGFDLVPIGTKYLPHKKSVYAAWLSVRSVHESESFQGVKSPEWCGYLRVIVGSGLPANQHWPFPVLVGVWPTSMQTFDAANLMWTA